MNDRPLPSSIHIERSVLGTFLISNRMWLKYGYMLKPEYFYDGNIRKIFDYISKTNCTDRKLIQESLPTVKDFLADLIMNHMASGNFQEEIRILRDMYSRRKLIEISMKAIESSYTDFDTKGVDITDNTISEINTEHIIEGKPEHIRDLMPSVFERMQSDTTGTSDSYKTGLVDVDKMFGGFVKKEMSILAARPSMGKTSFVLHIIRNIAITENIPVLFFSLEMGRESISSRILFAESDASYGSALLGNKSEFVKIKENIDRIMKANIYIDDTAGMTVNNIQTKSENYVKNFGVKIIFIDHRGFIKPALRGRSTNDEVSEISKGICNIAKKLDVPVVLVSQLSREVERRKPSIPMLSDLRDSGTLEEDARKVIMLYREDYYDRECKTPGVTQVIVAKNHNGETGVRNVFFNKEKMTFCNIDNSDYNSYQGQF